MNNIRIMNWKVGGSDLKFIKKNWEELILEYGVKMNFNENSLKFMITHLFQNYLN